MDFFLNMTLLNLQMAAMYGVLALGVYITYSILDFPDLSVDGTVPLGGVVSAMLILKGVNPWLALLAAFAAGAAAGCVTGLLHVKLKIRPLLCGILVMTALPDADEGGHRRHVHRHLLRVGGAFQRRAHEPAAG